MWLRWIMHRNFWKKLRGSSAIWLRSDLLGSFEEAVAVVEFVKENPVDMVFTDIVMPDISGISLAKELQKLKNAPAVVLMSSIPGFSLEAWKIQAYGFIEKPYTKQDIMKMVERYRRESENGVDGSF